MDGELEIPLEVETMAIENEVDAAFIELEAITSQLRHSFTGHISRERVELLESIMDEPYITSMMPLNAFTTQPTEFGRNAVMAGLFDSAIKTLKKAGNTVWDIAVRIVRKILTLLGFKPKEKKITREEAQLLLEGKDKTVVAQTVWDNHFTTAFDQYVAENILFFSTYSNIIDPASMIADLVEESQDFWIKKLPDFHNSFINTRMGVDINTQLEIITAFVDDLMTKYYGVVKTIPAWPGVPRPTIATYLTIEKRLRIRGAASGSFKVTLPCKEYYNKVAEHIKSLYSDDASPNTGFDPVSFAKNIPDEKQSAKTIKDLEDITKRLEKAMDFIDSATKKFETRMNGYVNAKGQVNEYSPLMAEQYSLMIDIYTMMNQSILQLLMTLNSQVTLYSRVNRSIAGMRDIADNIKRVIG